MVHNKEVKRPRQYLPFMNNPICGHNPATYDGCIGREHSVHVFKGRNIDYLAGIEIGPCPICDKDTIKRYQKIVDRLEADRLRGKQS